ncbi:MAG: conjugal transfer protein TrbF [Sphingomonadales bacterium]|nr:conjugal transfer protein TrbF [Sphingomonadales bacterium]
MFKRSANRYSTTPVPVTPYQKAAQVWDERLGSARVQARNWRFMAFGALGLATGLALALVTLSLQSRITPYVVELEAGGNIRVVGPAREDYRPTDAQIAWQLARFIAQVRSLPLDPLVLRQNWLEAYDYATDRAALILNEYARETDPFARVGQTTVTVEVTSVVRASDTSFQVKWTETSFVNGVKDKSERHTAILTIVLSPPKTVEQVRKNPLGLYVHGISWTRDFG